MFARLLGARERKSRASGPRAAIRAAERVIARQAPDQRANLPRRRAIIAAMKLVPCDHCARHLRIGERLCPFCGLTRAALGVALGIAMVGCGGGAASRADTTTTPDENGTEEQHATTDAPPSDEPPSDESPNDEPGERGPDGVGAVAAYGAPAPDGPGQP
jgi:hypothetical protein